MKILELKNPKQFMQVLPSIIMNGGAILHRTPTPLVHLGLDEDINEDYCDKNNIPIFRVQRSGGAIVSNSGDFDFVIVDKETNVKEIPPLFQRLIQLLDIKGVKFKIENNDILAIEEILNDDGEKVSQGYKVASYAYRDVPGGTYTAMHISMSVDLELIKNICKKEMKKIPKGLNDFGIFAEDIVPLYKTSN